MKVERVERVSFPDGSFVDVPLTKSTQFVTRGGPRQLSVLKDGAQPGASPNIHFHGTLLRREDCGMCTVSCGGLLARIKDDSNATEFELCLR